MSVVVGKRPLGRISLFVLGLGALVVLAIPGTAAQTPSMDWSIDCGAMRKQPDGKAFVVRRNTMLVERRHSNRFGLAAGQVIARRGVTYFGADLFDIVDERCGTI